MMKLPPQLKNQYEQLIQTEQRIRTFNSQKSQWEIQKATIENAISELETTKEKNPNTEVYKNAGAILIKVNDIDKAIQDLKEKEELLNMRLKTVNKQIERINQQYEAMKDKFQKSIQQFTQPQDFQNPM
ncbi:MAG: prefoldin subunit beta [Candidatus Helarchaeota archaeon]